MKRRDTTLRAEPRAGWANGGVEADALLDLARSLEPRAAGSEQEAAESFALLAREHVEAERRRRGGLAWGGWRYAAAVVAVAAAALVGLKMTGLVQPEALAYHVKHGNSAGRLIDARGEPVELEFSDGTLVTVERGSQARVAEATPRGAHFQLSSGRMRFSVVPHADRGNWLVDAGPFQVRVTGTVFTVEWLAAQGSFRVEVTRGHVIVEGAGQRRELGPGDSFQHQEPIPTNEGEADAADHRATPPVADAPPAPATSEPSSSATAKSPSWTALVAAGDFTAVIDAANRRGLTACLDACSQEDLRALADAARLGGSASLAQRALLAQRARFARSSDAAAAAFLLGRAAEDRHDGQAVAWYDRYLSEAPNGRFAGDALARKMLLLAPTDAKTAVALAEQYLARYPSGPYRAHAASLIEAGQAR
jgi:hypothetical protein